MYNKSDIHPIEWIVIMIVLVIAFSCLAYGFWWYVLTPNPYPKCYHEEGYGVFIDKWRDQAIRMNESEYAKHCEDK